jgi:hypothetical protein
MYRTGATGRNAGERDRSEDTPFRFSRRLRFDPFKEYLLPGDIHVIKIHRDIKFILLQSRLHSLPV